VTRTTLDLLTYWTREGRDKRLFYAQREATQTIIFLKEARGDFLQGIAIPRDEPSDERKEEGYAGFLRYACKMATGAGKTTVMGMLAAWSILNKINDRSDGRFSDLVLVVCPNVTIRDRLTELDPERDEASIYRTRDLVPPHLMPLLRQGKVLVTNWHVFQPQVVQTGGVGAKVVKAGVPVRTVETVVIGTKTATQRDSQCDRQPNRERHESCGESRDVAPHHQPGCASRVNEKSCGAGDHSARLGGGVVGPDDYLICLREGRQIHLAAGLSLMPERRDEEVRPEHKFIRQRVGRVAKKESCG